ncbi:MAG: POTRA domain-containing protein, partial [Syntrophales bacterium]|nr:POTRA domain-containing protein [Syntrophales bacterium]
MNRKTLSIICSFALFFLLLAPELYAEDVKKIALLPFQIHSKANYRYLQDAIYDSLESRLKKIKNIQVVDREHLTGILAGKNVDDSLALEVGKKAGAAFVITGSVTELGDIISADIRILDVKTGGFLPVIFAQGKGPDGIDNIASQLHGDILIRLGAEQRIARIEFKGNRRIESGAINQVIKSATGSIFSDANLSHDIKSIYKMGYFTDVTAQATDSPEGKIITFLVQEKGIITSIQIKGHKSLSKDDIEAVLTVKVKQTLSQERVKADVSKIKDLYNNKGYYSAEVTDVIE